MTCGNSSIGRKGSVRIPRDRLLKLRPLEERVRWEKEARKRRGRTNCPETGKTIAEPKRVPGDFRRSEAFFGRRGLSEKEGVTSRINPLR